MIVNYVDADCLATLLLLDKEMEQLPEPLRMQPNSTFVITLDAFKTFVSDYLSIYDYLCLPTRDLKNAIASDFKPLILKGFYMCVARAVAKELHYAERYGKDATTILHSIEGSRVRTMSLGKVETEFHNYREKTEVSLGQYMAERDFMIPGVFRRANYPKWKYACVLEAWALEGYGEWTPSFKIIPEEQDSD